MGLLRGLIRARAVILTIVGLSLVVAGVYLIGGLGWSLITVGAAAAAAGLLMEV